MPSIAKKKIIHGNEVVIEANEIARAQLAPPAESVWEERIIAQIAAYIKQNDGDFPESAFLVGQLVDTKKVSNSQLKEIEKASDRLVGSTFKVKRTKNFWWTYSVFSYIKYEDGIISAKFNQDLKKYYLELEKQFAVRSLPEFRKLSSVYSQIIFRTLNSWAGLPHADIALEELYRLTNPPPSVCIYKNFKTRVLDIAHKEIHAKTSFKYSWEPIKPKNKVLGIRFFFDQK